MKKILLFITASLIFTSCIFDDDDTSNPIQNQVQDVSNFMTTSSNGFRIILFIEDGTNKTGLMSPYRFVFNADGTVVATSNSNQTINGTYMVYLDDNKIELMMNFPLNSPLYELTDDWYYITTQGNIIKFSDGPNDVLHFQKQ